MRHYISILQLFYNDIDHPLINVPNQPLPLVVQGVDATVSLYLLDLWLAYGDY
jgi:hypothetical protein